MGIDNDAKLVVGWTLIQEDMKRWAKAKGFSLSDGIFSFEDWDLGTTDWFIGYASPYFDCPAEEYDFFLSMKFSSKEIPFERFPDLLNPKKIAQGRKLATEFGVSKEEPLFIFALPHIW